MIIDAIYVDIDGVLADFAKRYEDLYGISPNDVKAKPQFHTNFHNFIETEQFVTLEPMPDAIELLVFIDSLDTPQYILGSTAHDKVHEEASRQKNIWLTAMDIEYPRIFVPGKRLKAAYAKPNSVLIDDTKSNIDQWNEKGGIGILHTDAESTIRKMRVILGA